MNSLLTILTAHHCVGVMETGLDGGVRTICRCGYTSTLCEPNVESMARHHALHVSEEFNMLGAR